MVPYNRGEKISIRATAGLGKCLAECVPRKRFSKRNLANAYDAGDSPMQYPTDPAFWRGAIFL
jgi:hypothetical protein